MILRKPQNDERCNKITNELDKSRQIRRKFTYLDKNNRDAFIKLVTQRKMTWKKAAMILNIRYSLVARHLIRDFRAHN